MGTIRGKSTDWMDPIEISKWAYDYCANHKNDPEVALMITDEQWIYHYCHLFGPHPELKKRIKEEAWAYFYCKDVHDDPEIRARIKTPEFACKYIAHIRDDERLLDIAIKHWSKGPYSGWETKKIWATSSS